MRRGPDRPKRRRRAPRCTVCRRPENPAPPNRMTPTSRSPPEHPPSRPAGSTQTGTGKRRCFSAKFRAPSLGRRDSSSRTPTKRAAAAAANRSTFELFYVNRREQRGVAPLHPHQGPAALGTGLGRGLINESWVSGGAPMSALGPTPVANPRIWALPPVEIPDIWRTTALRPGVAGGRH